MSHKKKSINVDIAVKDTHLLQKMHSDSKKGWITAPVQNALLVHDNETVGKRR